MSLRFDGKLYFMLFKPDPLALPNAKVLAESFPAF